MKVSIIVPTLNRSASLFRTISSISLQTFPADEFEIIIVDNGSTDRTREIINALVEKCPHHQIRYFYEPEPGNLAARHRGALEALGELFIFVDDDVEAAPGWLKAIVAGFDDVNVQLIGGRNVPKYEVDPPAWIESFWDSTPDGGRSCWYLSLLELGQKRRHMNPGYIWTLNFSIRRNAFYDLGGFHPDSFPDNLQHFDGDGENGLTIRAEARRLVAIYEPAATVYHFIPASRMTSEYFERRAYSEGIRNSYSKVRYNSIKGVGLLAKMRRIGGGFLRDGKRLVHAETREERTIAEIFRHVADARQAGFEFHQRMIRADKKLLDWVLRPYYWDYRLPR